ncbi:hypothetical protein TVAG_066930 [Trichomonas vaginalis G3]|uniref:Uncharacterized protein n=1 Tax=Trichomonas vaginalis (strain ATCC PRA-98 / G3) TaxID=412133 RepID=A2DSA9_TRIV3|nr:hypothetical protein TVAGG3_0078990 [Trichomonas vaginalis G3]EAY16688.1 hypothetical protein TVAG_066930 [Trichomonas vaginalis G3]KAI5543110.1 hypothetical protein TVAGG3_0078990 [Trichomonas vaginalis G3]|eukprot:XP_001328911.1 hypothetical protein [Trichomonas vaginalis G3]
MNENLDDIFDTSLGSVKDIENDTNPASSDTNKNFEEETINESDNKSKSKQISNKQLSSREINEIKAMQNQKLFALKQQNLAKEQALASSNDLKYRDYLWDITCKYFNKGCFADNLQPQFDQKLADEEFKLKKEIIALQEQNKEEIRLAKEAMKTQNIKSEPQVELLEPQKLAQILYDSIYDSDIFRESSDINKIIDQILQKLENNNNAFSDSSGFSESSIPMQSPIRNQYSSPPLKVSPPKLVPRSTPKTNRNLKNDPALRRNIQERKKLKQSIEQTNKFLAEMKRQSWFGEFM